MNQMPSASWSPTVSGPEDDFSNFLEFSDLQLDFSSFDDNSHNGENIQAGGDAMDVQNNATDDLLEFRQLGNSSAATGFDGPIEAFPDMQMQSQQLDQHLSPHLTYGHPFAAHNVVPPTPNSMEIHGSQTQYDHALSNVHPQVTYANPRHTHDGQASCLMSLQYTGIDYLQDLYTPLDSPAVTPHDSHFQRAEYTITGDCFSPLTSPALKAQNQHPQRNVFEDIRSLDISRSISASDAAIDPSLSTPASKVAKKPNRRASAASKTPSRVVKQSPLMKAQARRRQTSGANIPPNKVSGLIEDAETSKPATVGRAAVRGNLPLSNSLESSEAESISPEPLSEILMPPPATPKSSSASKSPYLIANNNGHPSMPLPAVDNQPATPASLMRIRKGNGKAAGSTLREQSSVLDSDEEHAAEKTVQPEPAKTHRGPSLTPIKTSDAQDGESTPTIPARKNPRVNPTSAPATATASVQPSPQFDATSTSGGPTDPTGSGRTAKKRTSSSSVQVSPALRPRISPSIKPLLPEGVVSAETSALILASKSNYQNLLEGTHLPGVSYPETLSTNLTSKRTSHRLAEQGRRTRINSALQEIATLLPPATPPGSSGSPVVGREGGGGGGGSVLSKDISPGSGGIVMTGLAAAQQNNSKASTVEAAIAYIKALQSELKEVKSKLDAAEKKLDGQGTKDNADG